MLDLKTRLLTDGKFLADMEALSLRFAELESSRSKMPDYIARRDELLLEIFRRSGNNTALLSPWLFPRFPKSEPLSIISRPFNLFMFHYLPYSAFVVRGSRQFGKAQPYSEPVATPRGWAPMGSLKVGDLVFGRDGKPCRVLAIHEQGERPVYKVRFSDDAWARCDLDHLWTVRRPGCDNWTTESLREIMGGISASPESGLAVRIPLADPVEYTAREHALSPYAIGALLGGGDLGNNGVYFTTLDQQVLDSLLTGNELGAARDPEKPGVYKLADRRSDGNALHEELRRLCLLLERPEEKFIPEEYLFDSVQNRLMLLRGLMDTSGSALSYSTFEFSTSSAALSRGFSELATSLGGKTRTKDRPLRIKDGERGYKNEQLSFHVVVSQLPYNPFLLERKASRFCQIQHERTRTMLGAEEDGVENCRCIEVDSPDRTYLTRHHVVTHNTVSLGARFRMAASLFKYYKMMYVVPHQDQLVTFARDKFRAIDRAFRFPVTDNRLKQNQLYREYPSSSTLFMARVNENADSVRGQSCDELALDECQGMDPKLELAVAETMSDSDIKLQLYTGTSTTMDTLLEARFQEGTQGTWHIDLGDNRLLDCGDAEQVIPFIQPQGFIDPKTSNPVDPLKGRFIYKNPAGAHDRIFSIHVPKIINPAILQNELEWSRLYRTLQRDKTSFIQECLGIPVAEADREITLGDLKRICVLPQGPEERKRLCRTKQYKFLVSGLDWGGSDYNPALKTKVSWTTHAIMGMSVDKKVHLLHARKYSGKDYRTIMNMVAKDHSAYCAGAIGSDIGVGEVYHEIIRSHPSFNPRRHLIFHYTGPLSPICSRMSKGNLPNIFNLNRTESITALILAIASADPMILAPSWDEVGEYLEDFLNVYRILGESVSGQKTFKYLRHGSKSDDTVHAMNFAYTMLRLCTGTQLLFDMALQSLVRDVVAGTATLDFVGDPVARMLSEYANSSPGDEWL